MSQAAIRSRLAPLGPWRRGAFCVVAHLRPLGSRRLPLGRAPGTKQNHWDCVPDRFRTSQRAETLQMAKKGIITTAGKTISDTVGSAATMATDMAAGVALVATGTARKAVRGAQRLLPNVPKKRRAAAKRKVTTVARKVRKATAAARRSAA